MITAETSCSHCHSEKFSTQRIALPNGGHHVKATCAACGRFLKFLPHDSPQFYFGRYKGLTVVEVAANNPGYLKWCFSKDIIKNGRLKDAVEYEVLTT